MRRACEGPSGSGVRASGTWLLVGLGTIGAWLGAGASGAGASVTGVDLDVGVPPGSPLDYGQAFPAITPSRGPLFPTTPTGRPGPDDDPNRSVSAPAKVDMDVRVATSFGLIRILTWDLTAHLTWLREQPEDGAPGPRSGQPVADAPMPTVGSSFYWVCMAPLLRLLLHPTGVSRAATVAHLVEIGEPSLSVVDAAKSERTIAPVCRELEERIGVDRAPFPAPPEDATTREQMLWRFAIDELVADHPYDPESGFGARLFLFGEELEPTVTQLCAAEDSFLSRNAVAALGRYPTLDAQAALFDVALGTEDSVTLVRALAAVRRGARCDDLDDVLDVADDRNDEVHQVCWIGALGRMGDPRAVPTLLEIGETALRGKDPDVLQAVLLALLTVQRPPDREALAEFAHDVRARARGGRGSFDGDIPQGPHRADVPDPPGLGASIIGQLGLLLEARNRPGDERLQHELGEIAPGGREPNAGFVSRNGNFALSQVHAVARFAYLDVVRDTSADAVEILTDVAMDPTVDAALRGYALSRLPFLERSALAAELFDGNRAGEIRIHAFEVLAQDRHENLVDYARGILDDCAATESGGGTAEARYLYTRALRALEDERELTAERLEPLLHHAGAARDAFGNLPERVLAAAEELVSDAARGASRNQLRPKVRELVDEVSESGINPTLSGGQEDAYASHVEGLLDGVRAHRSDTNYLESIELQIVQFLLGFATEGPSWNGAEIEPEVLLEEEILLALGRLRTPEASALLQDFVGEHRGSKHVAVAALAVGVCGDPGGGRAIVSLLADEDPFVRLCAYEALRHLTGLDVEADWYGGERVELTKRAEEYFRWYASR